MIASMKTVFLAMLLVSLVACTGDIQLNVSIDDGLTPPITSSDGDLDNDGIVDADDAFPNDPNRPIDPNYDSNNPPVIVYPTSQSLLAYYNLNESVGKITKDSSGNGADAKVSVSAFTQGYSGHALNLGVSFLEVPDSVLNQIDQEFTLSFFAKGVNTYYTSIVHGIDSDGNQALNVALPWVDTILFDVENDTGKDRLSGQVEVSYNDVWNHWAITKNTANSEMSVYLNGELALTTQDKNRDLSSLSKLRFGRNNNEDSRYQGLIDKIAIYNTSLDQADIQALANAEMDENYVIPSPVSVGFDIQHPGILVSQKELDAIKQSFDAGNPDRIAMYDEMMKLRSGTFDCMPPQHMFGRSSFDDPAKCTGRALNRYVMDYILTGSLESEAEAITLLNRWGDVESFTINPDDNNGNHRLVGGIKLGFIHAFADLLRSHGTSWSQADQDRFSDVTRNILLPMIYDGSPIHFAGNWQLAIGWSSLAMAVWLDDEDIFLEIINNYKYGNSENNARMSIYLLPNGQAMETARDQVHAQMGIQAAAQLAQVAWNQGIDLYEGETYSIGRAFEHYILYNEGEDDVPFQKYSNTFHPDGQPGWENQTEPNDIGNRGTSFRPIYSMVQAHYQNYRNTVLPNVKAFLGDRNETPGPGVQMHAGFLFKDLPGIEAIHAPADVSVTLQADEWPKLPLVLLNLAGERVVDKERGAVFVVDTQYEVAGGKDYHDLHATITETNIPEIYRSFYRGENGNTINLKSLVPNGDYIVRLHFAEIQKEYSGERVFDVHVEGQMTEDNLDVLSRVGKNQPLIIETYATVTDGEINIDLYRHDWDTTDASDMEPFLSAFEVIKN